MKSPMNKRQFLSTMLATAALAPFRSVLAAEDGFTPLFDGKTLTGWKNPYDWGKAEVVDGEIRLTAEKKFFLVTEKSYGDFIFVGEILLPEGKANSGFMFRAHVEKNKVFGYQAEVDGDENRKWSGGLYDEGRRKWFISPNKDANPDDKAAVEASIAAFRKRAGDAFKRQGWNTYRISCQGKKIKIEVNGVVTSDVEDGMDASGPIGIQHHGEKGQTYRFRNLRIKELK
jgi:Domain of Unknown Function (DUF1080)